MIILFSQVLPNLNQIPAAAFLPSSPYFGQDSTLAFSCIYNGLEDPSHVEWFKVILIKSQFPLYLFLSIMVRL